MTFKSGFPDDIKWGLTFCFFSLEFVFFPSANSFLSAFPCASASKAALASAIFASRFCLNRGVHPYNRTKS